MVANDGNDTLLAPRHNEAGPADIIVSCVMQEGLAGCFAKQWLDGEAEQMDFFCPMIFRTNAKSGSVKT